MKLLILMGLTGVGKSTAISALQVSGTAFTLLPNRRALTDTLIIPEIQRVEGKPVVPVSDRLERFALTRRYRERHPGGMAHVLSCYFDTNPPVQDTLLVFDNLRGLDEVRAGVETFPAARFILLSAPPLVRLQRLVGRADDFDRVATAQRLSGSLRDLEGLETVFNSGDLAGLEASGVSAEAILKGVRIIFSEAQNYDMRAAAAYLREAKDTQDFLYLETEMLTVREVQTQIMGWL